MGVDFALRGGFFSFLLTSSFEETSFSLEFNPYSYMDQLPLVPCLSPSSIGLDLSWFVTS